MAESLPWLALAIAAGAATQRVTGLGFALVASPFLVLLLGPFEGVLLSNALGMLASAVVLAQTWRDTQVRRALLLFVPAMAAIVPGAWVAQNMPAPVLSVVVGSLVLVALVAVLVARPAGRRASAPGAVIAGAASGFMNVTAGVGGPAITVYALSTRWPHRPFVATVQLYFVLLNAGSIMVKGWPGLPAATWTVGILALVVGIVSGHRLSRRIPAHRARAAVVVLAVAGSLATVAKGLVAW